ncbi:MAG: DNA primase [Thermodesulfobacteriota bacterium]|nr:DNA primase [Thermodesulfobacteriota bacterium]
MGRIPEDIIMQVREQIDIVDLISGYVELKHSGANHKGLCPFHNEKTPSFNVNSTRQIFHCFGCGVGGNVFSFLMRMDGIAFPQAVRRLAEQAGIDIPEDEPNAFELQRRKEREQFNRVYEIATTFYHQVLLNDPRAAQARGYIRRRGFDSDAVRRFRLGYAPSGWNALCEHLKQESIDPEQAKLLGLIRSGKEGRGDYDMFCQRLLFPIDDMVGHVVAFGGRVLDDSLPKYINSPESPLYHKSSVLYGLYQAKNEMRRQRKVVVVEGYFDHLALVQAGIEHVVATCGTALTGEHAKVLKRYVEQVVLLFDQDKAGQKACFRAMPVLLQAELQVMTLSLPEGDDPDTCVRREGFERFGERLDGARSAVDYHMEVTLGAAGDNAEAKAQAINEILVMIRQVPGEIERDLHLASLAHCSGVAPDLLRRQLERTVVYQEPERRTPRPSVAVPQNDEALAYAGQQEPYREDYAESLEDSFYTTSPAHHAVTPSADTRTQKWLLSLMMADEQVSHQAMEAGLESLFEDKHCRYLADIIYHAWQDKKPPGEWLLDSCEDQERQALLTQILIRGKEFPDENKEEIFSDCRLAVARGQLKQRRTELHTLMREAEHQGDSDRQTVCLQELTRINRQLKNRTL